jgi:hypothetical protein
MHFIHKTAVCQQKKPPKRDIISSKISLEAFAIASKRSGFPNSRLVPENGVLVQETPQK